MSGLKNAISAARRFAVHARLVERAAVALLATATFDAAGAPAAPHDAIVLHWNEIAVQVIGATPPFPSTRAMATVQLAVFEAVNAITQRYQPYLGTVAVNRQASAEAAAATAAHDTLLWLYPAQQGLLDTRRAESLDLVADGPAKEQGIAVGRAAAAAMIALRTDDGAQTPMFYTSASAEPYEWQPTPLCANAPANGRGLFLHWQFVKPFGVESAAQFRAKAPPALVSGLYAKDLNEVEALGDAQSALRPPDRAAVARLYAAQPPHRGWNLIARQLAAERGPDEITRTARVLALMNMSLSDAHITVFESKYHYRTWRPETAIARADEDGNHRTAASATYRPYVPAPCFPSYPSAHGSGAGAASTVLERAYGRNHHDLVNTDAGAPDVVVHYSDLRTITDDVDDARVYGGIHFRFDQDAGERLGAEVARFVAEHWLLAVDPSNDD